MTESFDLSEIGEIYCRCGEIAEHVGHVVRRGEILDVPMCEGCYDRIRRSFAAGDYEMHL